MIQNFWDAAFVQNMIDCHDKGLIDDAPDTPGNIAVVLATFNCNLRNKLQSAVEVWIWQNVIASVGEKRVLYVERREFSPVGKLVTRTGMQVMDFVIHNNPVKRYSDKYGHYYNRVLVARDIFGAKWTGVWHDHEDCVLMKKQAKHRPAKVGDRIKATTTYTHSHNYSRTGIVTSVYETKDGDYSYKIDSYFDYVNHWMYRIQNLSR